MNTKNFLTGIFLILVAFTACNKDSIEDNKTLCPVEFKMTVSENSTKSAVGNKLKTTEVTNVKSALVSIADDNGNLVYELEQIELISFNGGFITNKLLLEVGNYTVTEFLLLDTNGNVAYATPKDGSDLANLVNDPLAINFSVNLNETTTVTPEVLRIDNFEPADFGYVEFGFRYIKTFNFVMGIYTLDNNQTAIASNANITLTANNKEYLNKEINGALNVLTINDGLQNYSIKVEKSGYKTFSETYTAEQLKQYETTPLNIYLEEIKEFTLDYNKITDATLTSYYPDNNENGTFIQAFTWTFTGDPVSCRFLMGFDLSEIPEGQQIKSAKLSLFYADNHPDPLHEGFFGGQNNLKIELADQAWDETTVTWNNQPSTISNGAIIIPSDENGKIDKPDIDITPLIQAMINNSDGRFGIKISQVDETIYRSSFFASTENELVNKRPILKIVLN
ncbi:DNRLRE domain-containing protein [Labilibaculum euxinus]